MKKTKMFLGAVALACMTTAAHAEEFFPGTDFSANVGLVSQYSFRGIAQSDEHPALQGGFDLSHESGLYAGVWGSNVDFNDGDQASVEIDGYLGFSNQINNFNYDAGLIYYAYPGADSTKNYDFMEASFAVGYDFEVAAVSASVNYSPEFFADSGDAWYTGASVDVPLPKDFSLNGHVGYQTIQDNSAYGVKDYADWSLGAGYSYKGVDFLLQYVDTNLSEPTECADGCAERVIFGISKTF